MTFPLYSLYGMPHEHRFLNVKADLPYGLLLFYILLDFWVIILLSSFASTLIRDISLQLKK